MPVRQALRRDLSLAAASSCTLEATASWLQSWCSQACKQCMLSVKIQAAGFVLTHLAAQQIEPSSKWLLAGRCWRVHMHPRSLPLGSSPGSSPGVARTASQQECELRCVLPLLITSCQVMSHVQLLLQYSLSHQQCAAARAADELASQLPSSATACYWLCAVCCRRAGTVAECREQPHASSNGTVQAAAQSGKVQGSRFCHTCGAVASKAQGSFHVQQHLVQRTHVLHALQPCLHAYEHGQPLVQADSAMSSTHPACSSEHWAAQSQPWQPLSCRVQLHAAPCKIQGRRHRDCTYSCSGPGASLRCGRSSP